jgi:nitroreductase
MIKIMNVYNKFSEEGKMIKSTLDDIIGKRRSVRKYSEKKIEKRKLFEILDSSRFAPSACNKQPWRFIIVDQKKKVQEIFNKCLGGIVSNRWAQSVPVFVVACARKSLLVHKVAERYKNVPYHYLDMGAAIEHILLKATQQGLGTCWIGWFNKRSLRKILHIPRGVEIVSLIAIGYASEDVEIKERESINIDEILFWNEYGKPEKESYTSKRNKKLE